MHSSVRQRTAGQRSNPDDQGEVLIQDEQEQEEEITSLRENNISANRFARRSLDVILFFTFMVNSVSIYRYLSSRHFFLALITLCQHINLFLNISPETVPDFRQIRLEIIQRLLLATTVMTICGCTRYVRGERPWNAVEGAMLFLPLLVSFGSWLQKKGEADAEDQLKELEGKRYKMKGA